jgi:hypothetical protein
VRFVFLCLALAACTDEAIGLDGGGLEDMGSRADAGASPDAEPIEDARVVSPADYWTLERTEAYLEVRASFNSGLTPYLRVITHPMHVCEHGGPVQVHRAGGGTFVVESFVWVQHLAPPGEGPCGPVADEVIRDVPLPMVGPGTYEAFDSASGRRVRFEVVDAPACGGSGDECKADCECSDGMECLAGVAGALGRCGFPCTLVDTGCCSPTPPDPNLECPPEMFCVADPDHASGHCEPHRSDPCTSDSECPRGMRCPVTDVPRGCVWEVELNASERHPCETSVECSAGLVCVERNGMRSCEVPCFTNEMRCPPMHACSSDRGFICEWLGE